VNPAAAQSNRWQRLAWAIIAASYAIPFLLCLPLLVRQYTTLTGVALQMGFQNWTSAAQQAALDAIGLPAGVWAVIRLAAELLTTLGSAAMGLLIFARRAGERFGLFVSLFLVSFGVVSSGAFGALRFAHPELETWLSLWVALPWLAFYVFFYTFPTGQFVPRWTAVWTPVFLMLLVTLFVFFPESGEVLGFPLILVAFGSALFAQIYRYARVSNPVQRAQTKWVTLAIVVIALGEIIGQGILPALFPTLVTEPVLRLRYGMALVVFVPIFLLVPLAVAIAVLRYRLWDIDVIIRRTLIYSVLTGTLALAYFGIILVLQAIFAALTGESRNELVTVISTLAIAALFVPLRGQVQGAIDRRFYRKKYDAARTLAAFGTQARDVMELEQLGSQLLRAVDDTMQPAHVGLWLSSATPGRENRHLTGSRLGAAYGGSQSGGMDK